MTKMELIINVAEKANLSQKEAANALNVILDVIQNSLEEGENVKITGFGRFSVSDHKERIGRNPKTGEKIFIPQRKIVRFKAGKFLRASVKK